MPLADRSWLLSFPQLAKIQNRSWQTLLMNVSRLTFNQGEMIYRDGDLCDHFLFVLSGTVKVQKISSTGHEITLYRIHSGEVCEITSGCMLAHDTYHAEAIAEDRVTLISVKSHFFLDALKDSDELQAYIYSNVEHGLNSLLDLIGEIAFESVDARLAKALIKHSEGQNVVLITHHELAANIGTAREVISRMLKQFECNGWVKLGRGRIIIDDIRSIQKLAS